MQLPVLLRCPSIDRRSGLEDQISSHCRQSVWLRALSSLLAALSLAGSVPLAAQSGALISEPFVVEHHMLQFDGEDATPFVGQSVTDYYGGSWIVSVRPDSSRLVVDLARRELTEIRPESGSYWTLTFDRFAELRARFLASELGRAERAALEAQRHRVPVPSTRSGQAAPGRAAPTSAARLVVEEGPEIEGRSLAPKARGGGSQPDADSSLLAAPRVRHLQVALESGGTKDVLLEVWVDPRVRLSPRALQALARFESSALGTPSFQLETRAAGLQSPLAAAREHADGAFVVRTVRPLDLGAVTGRVEDVATRLEPLPSFPVELVEIPAGLRRAPHPLEAVLAAVDNEAGHEALIGNPPVEPREP